MSKHRLVDSVESDSELNPAAEGAGKAGAKARRASFTIGLRTGDSMPSKSKPSQPPKGPVAPAAKNAISVADGTSLRQQLALFATALSVTSIGTPEAFFAEAEPKDSNADPVDKGLTLLALQKLFDELGLPATQRDLGRVSNNDEILETLSYSPGVGGDLEKRIDAVKQWNSASGTTAHECFLQAFADVPFEERPTADQIHQASRRFYNTLTVYLRRQGQAIGDVFPIDPNARGGAKAKGGGDLSHEGLLARLERTRASARQRMAEARKRQKLEHK